MADTTTTTLAPVNAGDVILDLQGVGKHFSSADGHQRTVLAGVSVSLHAGEIVALLGASGSGKSTLLRIMAGLISADGGTVRYRGQPLWAPARGIGMVFQSFALFPWLTVQQNVELGLEARGMAAAERERRAAAAIALIGLAGFEGALPRELSGGMRQRVGIARALVVQPDVLLMDEAFSALDVLTGERLRDDILALWTGGSMPTQAMLVVSHNIEEAVLMADRVLIFASDPGRVAHEVAITLPRPRQAADPAVRALVDELYARMTHRSAPASTPGSTVVTDAAALAGPATPPKLALTDRLPEADVSRMDGLLELLAAAPFAGHADLPLLAQASELSDTALLPVARALALLGLVVLEGGDLHLTPLGQRYVAGGHQLRQEVFGQQLLTHVPLAAHVRHSLEQSASGTLPDKPFVRLLAGGMGEREAPRTLHTLVAWARHGEVFAYNAATRQLHLPSAAARPAGSDGDA